MNLLDWFLIAIFILLVVCAIIYLVYGSFRSGRIMGGVYILYAPPGEGKSFVATHLALEYMKRARTVFTNFPVISPDLIWVSKLWIKKFMKENIFDSAVFIDESYKDYNSREYKTFSKDDHDWFATSGHNQNSIWLLTQNPQRIDTVIRELANFYVFVEKTEIPILEIPLFFTLYYYRSEEEMRVSKYGMAEPWDTQRIWFNWYTASSYDTRFFRKPADNVYKGVSWVETLEKRNFRYVPPTPTGIAFLKMLINTKTAQLISYMKKQWSGMGYTFDKSLEREKEKEKEPEINEDVIHDDS